MVQLLNFVLVVFLSCSTAIASDSCSAFHTIVQSCIESMRVAQDSSVQKIQEVFAEYKNIYALQASQEQKIVGKDIPHLKSQLLVQSYIQDVSFDAHFIDEEPELEADAQQFGGIYRYLAQYIHNLQNYARSSSKASSSLDQIHNTTVKDILSSGEVDNYIRAAIFKSKLRYVGDDSYLCFWLIPYVTGYQNFLEARLSSSDNHPHPYTFLWQQSQVDASNLARLIAKKVHLVDACFDAVKFGSDYKILAQEILENNKSLFEKRHQCFSQILINPGAVTKEKLTEMYNQTTIEQPSFWYPAVLVRPWVPEGDLHKQLSTFKFGESLNEDTQTCQEDLISGMIRAHPVSAQPVHQPIKKSSATNCCNVM